MPTKNQKTTAFQAVMTVHIHGVKLPVEYPHYYASKVGCKASAAFYRDDLREELASALGHSDFRIATAVKQVAI